MGGLGSGQVLPPGRLAPLLSLASLNLRCLAHTSLTKAGKGVGRSALSGFCLLFGKPALGLHEEAASRPLDLPTQMNTDGHIKPVTLFSLDPEVLPWRRGPDERGAVEVSHSCKFLAGGPSSWKERQPEARYPTAGLGAGACTHLLKRLLRRTIRRKPVGSVTELSLLFISSNCWSMMSPASLSVSLLAQALQGKPQSEPVGERKRSATRVCPEVRCHSPARQTPATERLPEAGVPLRPPWWPCGLLPPPSSASQEALLLSTYYMSWCCA